MLPGEVFDDRTILPAKKLVSNLLFLSQDLLQGQILVFCVEDAVRRLDCGIFPVEPSFHHTSAFDPVDSLFVGVVLVGVGKVQDSLDGGVVLFLVFGPSMLDY